jgi:hypothetical protein
MFYSNCPELPTSRPLIRVAFESLSALSHSGFNNYAESDLGAKVRMPVGPISIKPNQQQYCV